MTSLPPLFDRRLLRRRRDRLATGMDACNFLFEEAASRLVECLDDIRRPFPDTLVLGCREGFLARALEGRGGIERVVQTDISPEMTKQARQTSSGLSFEQTFVVADEEYLPFPPETFDLVISSLDFHWINDLPGTLVQVKTILKPDGLFLANLLGGESLSELRQAWQKAESNIENGISPRVSPFVDVVAAASLLQHAGFALSVTDCDTLAVTYLHPLELMRDLRRMGEANTLIERRRQFTRNRTLKEALRLYESSPKEENRFSATFQIITMTGWAPHSSQPLPLKPGTPALSLEKALKRSFS